MNNNKSLKSNNNKYITEKNKFYKIKSNITGSSLIHLPGFNNDYVEYTVFIKTPYGKWTFKKRYEDFLKLNNYLANIFPEITEYFPPRRFFKNSDNTIKERIIYFKKYLKFLFDNVNIFLFEDIINFIYLEKGMIGLFIKKYNMLKIDEENYIYSSLKEAFNRKTKKPNTLNVNNISEEDLISCLNNDNYYNAILEFEKKRQISFDWDEPSTVTPNTFVVREFLYNLSEKNENKADIIQNFELFLQKPNKWIKLSKKEILELFIGFDEELEDNNDDRDFNRTRTYEKDSHNTIKRSLFNWFDKDKKSKSKSIDMYNDEDDEDEQTKIPGLFQQIGDYTKNVFCAVGCLDLLEKLLNTEYNPDYEIYINIFKNMKIYEYNYMKLNNIIKNNIGGNKTNVKAMKLLNLIFSEKKWEKYKNEIITDENVYKQYINYINNFSE